MNPFARRFILLVLALFLLSAVPSVVGEDEADPNLPGNPECKICQGTGKVTYGKKAGKEKHILYCSVKDAGKRCQVYIGGWEPCLACEDWPGMQAIFDEHDQIRKSYRAMWQGYWSQVQKTGAPVPQVNAYITKHTMVFSDIDHSNGHQLAIGNEECFDQFDSDFSMGGEDSEWDKRHMQGKYRFILTQSDEQFRKLLAWFYDSQYIDHNSKALGRERYLKLGGAGFLGSRLSSKSPQDIAHDERGHMKSYSQYLLNVAFASEALKRGFPDWIDEGISNYYQSKLRTSVTWYTVAYGMGNRRDEEYWGKFDNWKEGLAKANTVPVAKFDENQGLWNGLIPMDTVIRMNITSMPNQAIAQSWAYINFLMGEGLHKKKAEEAKAQFKEFLKLVGSGMEQEAAFEQAYGVKKLSLLETKFRMWLRGFK